MSGEQPNASERALYAARFSLSRLAPEYSARRRLTFVQFGLLLGAALLAVAAYLSAPVITVAIGALIAGVIFTVIVLFRFVAAAFSLAPPRAPQDVWSDPLPIYTILCPLYREARVLPDLAARIAKLDYPLDRLDVKIILEADDVATIEAANRTPLGPQFELIVAPAGRPRTKPKALNYALTFARGAFVTVYDAEDDPDPRQLRAALDAFAAGGEDLGCVQAPLYFDNGGSSWIASQCAAEYAIQFGEVLPMLARCGLPLMLGGTSNHFRTHALIGAGGWDPFNVTEDADVGYRLAREGWRAALIEPPTWEEAPATLGAWIKQRARWIKGHIQTWAVLMREPARTWRELGAAGFLSMQLMLGGGVLAAATHGPFMALLAWAAFSQDFSLPRLSWALASAGYAVAIYNVMASAWLRRDMRLAFAGLTMPFYWPLASLAAAWALLQFVFKPHHWDKTEHGLTSRGRRAPSTIVDLLPPNRQTGGLAGARPEMRDGTL